MAYQINKTDGTILSTVPDGQVDSNSTNLGLIGKNYSGFGEILNENFVKLLENFAAASAPNRAIKGQLWFDTSENKVKVYNGLQFVPVSSATISASQPDSLVAGDLWYNNFTKQLLFFDGTKAVVLAPLYSETQGVSGLQVQNILDIENQSKVITLLYTNNILLGIFSKDKFTPKNPIAGYSEDSNGVFFQKEIFPGFNIGTHIVRAVNPLTNSLENIPLTFRVTAENAEKLGGLPSINYIRTDQSGTINGQLRVNSDLGLVVGSGSQANILVDPLGNVLINNQASERNLLVRVRKENSQETAVEIKSSSREIDFYTGLTATQSTVNIGGSLNVIGDLTVRGQTTTVSTQNLVIKDKSIELANTGDSELNTDENADQGGIILKGDTDKVIVWADSTGSTLDIGEVNDFDLLGDAWNISESLNLKQNKYYAIDGVPLIEQTSTSLGSKTFKLTSAVTAIDGVSEFGKQIVVNVGPNSTDDPAYLRLANNRISTLEGDGQPANLDLELDPAGTGNVALIGSPRITGLNTPVNLTDATNKNYVDTFVESRPLVFNLDLTDGKSNSYIINEILNNVAPPSGYRTGTQAKILCNILSNSATVLTIPPPTLSTATFVTPTGTAPAITNITIPAVSVAPIPISVTRVIKTFVISNGQWIYQTFPGDITLSA